MCSSSYLLIGYYCNICSSDTNKEKVSDKVFEPRSSAMNGNGNGNESVLNGNGKRVGKTSLKAQGHATVVSLLKIMSVVGIPIMYLLFNIIFFIIGSV